MIPRVEEKQGCLPRFLHNHRESRKDLVHLECLIETKDRHNKWNNAYIAFIGDFLYTSSEETKLARPSAVQVGLTDYFTLLRDAQVASQKACATVPITDDITEPIEPAKNTPRVTVPKLFPTPLEWIEFFLEERTLPEAYDFILKATKKWRTGTEDDKQAAMHAVNWAKACMTASKEEVTYKPGESVVQTQMQYITESLVCIPVRTDILSCPTEADVEAWINSHMRVFVPPPTPTPPAEKQNPTNAGNNNDNNSTHETTTNNTSDQMERFIGELSDMMEQATGGQHL